VRSTHGPLLVLPTATISTSSDRKRFRLSADSIRLTVDKTLDRLRMAGKVIAPLASLPPAIRGPPSDITAGAASCHARATSAAQSQGYYRRSDLSPKDFRIVKTLGTGSRS
jgi:hypothetical protein